MAVEKTIKIKGDASGAVNALNEVGAAADKTQAKAQQSSQAINDGMSAIDKRTGGAVSAFKSLTGGISSAVKGFGTLKGAIIATGLGALLVAITSLIAYFKETERGADQLRVITAALGAVMGKLMDVVIGLGESLFKAFSDPKQALIDFGQAIKDNIATRIEGILELLPALGKAIGLALKGEFSAAAKTAADAAGKVALGVENVTDKVADAAAAIGEFGKSIVAAGKEGARIGNLLNEVERAERQLITQRAIANKQIAEARFVADDLTKSVEERIAAVQLAAKLEGEVAEKELATQRKKAVALQQQADISESNKDTLREVAEAQARVSELEQASIARQRRLGIEIKGLRAEEKAAADEKIKLAQEFAAIQNKAAEDFAASQGALLDKAYEALLTDQQREINAVREKYFAMLNLTELSVDERLALEKKQSDEIIAIEEKTSKAKEAISKTEQDAKSAMMNQSIDAVQGALGSLFKNSKAVATANVIVDAAQAAVGVFKSSTSLPEPFGSINRGIQLAALAATTVASIRNINAAQPGASGPPTTQASIPTTTPSAQPMTPNINFNSTENQLQGLVNRPMRAYVVNQDINNANQLERRIRSSATIGG